MLKLRDLIGIIDYAELEYKGREMRYGLERLIDLPYYLLEKEVERIEDSGLDAEHLIILLI